MTIILAIFGSIITLFIAINTLLFKQLTDRAKQERQEAKKVLAEIRRDFEISRGKLQQTLDQTDHYLDLVLITFNELLSEEERITFMLLKHVLDLRSHADRERFIAIKALGELGDESVIPYLEWAAETDKKWAADARIAIEVIKKRMVANQGENTSS